MKCSKLIALAGISLSLTAGASELECIKKVASFLDIQPKEERVFSGTVADGECEVRVDYEKSISGITNEEYRYIRIENFFDEEYDGRTFKVSVNGYIHFNDSLSKQRIKSCEVKGNILILDIKLKNMTGWKKKYRYRMTIEKNDNGIKKITMQEKLYGSIWNSAGKEKGYCNIQQ